MNKQKYIISPRAASVFAVISSVIGLVSFIGWANNITFITRVNEHFIPIAPLTAWLLFFCGLSLYLIINGFGDFAFRIKGKEYSISLGQSFSFLIVILLVFIILNSLFGFEYDIESFLADESKYFGKVLMDRMSPVTAFSLLFSGISIFSRNLNFKIFKRISVASALIATSIGVVNLIGYIFNSPFLYGTDMIPMSLTTSIGQLTLGCALILSLDNRSWPLRLLIGKSISARLLRAFLPISILMVLFGNWLSTFHSKFVFINPSIFPTIDMFIVITVILITYSLISRKIGSEITKTHESLLEGERRFINLSKNLPIGVFRTDADGNCTYVNKRWCEIAGINVEDALGDGWINGIHPEDRKYVSTEWYKSAKADESFSLEYRFKKLDGTITNVYGNAHPEKDENGEIVAYTGIIIDITWKIKSEGEIRKLLNDSERSKNALLSILEDQNISQKALKRSEERYRTIFESVNDLMLFITTKGVILNVNDKTAEVYGGSKDEIIGKSLIDIGVINSHLVPFLYRTLIRSLKSKEFSFEFTFTNRSGRTITLNCNTARLFERNNVAGIIVIGRDITEKKKAEEELQKSKDKIAEFAGYLQTVREKERAVIARELHDEMGQILSALNISVSSLIRDFGEKKELMSREYLSNEFNTLQKMINMTIQRIRLLVTELRLEIPAEFSIYEAIIGQLNEFKKNTGINFNFHSNRDDIILDQDKTNGIFRIVQEALTNIIKHSKAKFVSLDFSVENTDVILIINDNGIGISDATYKKKKTWGLIGMKERASLLGGSLNILSKPGSGTEIYCIIPCGDSINRSENT